MNLRPYRSSDLPQLFELTIAAFGPFFEDSFRSIVGDVIMANQHGNWREDYREMWQGLHDPRNNKHVVVAEHDDILLGFADRVVATSGPPLSNSSMSGRSLATAPPGEAHAGRTAHALIRIHARRHRD